jgi:hypothetical protein
MLMSQVAATETFPVLPGRASYGPFSPFTGITGNRHPGLSNGSIRPKLVVWK